MLPENSSRTDTKEVLISAYTCCPNKGSEPGMGWNWITNYANNNYKVTVVTSGKYKNEIEEYQANHSLPVDFHFLDSNLSLKTLKIPVFGLYFHAFTWFYNARKKIRRLDAQNKYSHAHHVTYSSVMFGSPLYDLNSQIVLGPIAGSIRPHESIRVYFGKYWNAELFKDKIAKFLASINPTITKAVSSSSLILVSNKRVYDFVHERCDNPITYPMSEVGVAEYFIQDKPERNLNGVIDVLWTGRFLPRKGLNLAIDAFNKLVKTAPQKQFRFLIAGDGLLSNEVKAQVTGYGLDKYVHFLGLINHAALINLYRTSHVFLFPSLKDSCPMQVFEAMSSGLPVVSLNHQGMADQIIDGTGLKVPVGDNIDYPKELANAVLKVIEDDNYYQLMSKRAYEHGQNQLWKTKIDNFLNNILPNYVSENRSIK